MGMHLVRHFLSGFQRRDDVDQVTDLGHCV